MLQGSWRENLSERSVEHLLDGRRIDSTPFGARFLEFILRRPHRAREFLLLAGDLLGRQLPVRFHRLAIAPLEDGPSQLGRPAAHGRHGPIRVLMRRAADRLSLHAIAIHRLSLGSF